MAEPSKSYAEEPSDKQVEAAASEPVPAPRSPDTPPETPLLRIQVDGRETTAEPRIVGDNGVPAPAVRRRRQRKTLKRTAASSTEMIFNFAPPNAGLAAPPPSPTSVPASGAAQPTVPIKRSRTIYRIVSAAPPRLQRTTDRSAQHHSRTPTPGGSQCATAPCHPTNGNTDTRTDTTTAGTEQARPISGRACHRRTPALDSLRGASHRQRTAGALLASSTRRANRTVHCFSR